MKLKIKAITGTSKKEIVLPAQFNEPVRPDIIKRAFLVIQSNNRQKKGAAPDAGKRHSSYLSKRRNSYRSTYGIGQSRTPRKVMSRRGTRLNYVGAFAPQTVGGRRAHPPKSEKIITLNINKKERRKAIRSAMAAMLNTEFLKQKNYQIPSDYPFIIENSIEKISKTNELKKILEKLKIQTYTERKIRAGRGKTRGRKYTRKKGPLFVTSKPCELFNASKNLNVESCQVKNLNVKLLAPGGMPGRVVLFTEDAIEMLNKENLFFNPIKQKKEQEIKQAIEETTKPKKEIKPKKTKKAEVKKE